MYFGISIATAATPGVSTVEALHRVIEICQFAEELGFDGYHAAEQHFTPYVINPDSLQLFTWVAAKTTKLKFCTAVAVLPLHHPIQFAERSALLDVFSGGRLSIGVGRGYQRRAFEGYDVTMEDSSDRFDEYLDIVKRAWGPEPFTYDGRYYRNAEPISVNPKPVQTPHPPIWVAGVSFHSLEKIGRGDYGFIKNFADNLDTCREQAAVYRHARRAAGLPVSGDRARIGRQTCVLDDGGEADASAERYARQFQSLFANAVSKPPVGDSYSHYRSDQYLRDRELGGDFDYARYAAVLDLRRSEGGYRQDSIHTRFRRLQRSRFQSRFWRNANRRGSPCDVDIGRKSHAAFPLILWEEVMKILRTVLMACGLLAAFASPLSAQDYPSRRIRMIVPYPAGGLVDALARLIAEHLGKDWNQAVVVENRPGGATMIGTQAVINSPPDGYTLLLGNTNISINPSLQKSMPYDAEKQLAPVALINLVPTLFLVHPDVPVRSIKELIDFAKANPGKLNYSHGGHGSFPTFGCRVVQGTGKGRYHTSAVHRRGAGAQRHPR